MEIVFAAIGGTEVDPHAFSAGLDTLAERPDFDEVEHGFDVPFSICFRTPWVGERSAWSDVDVKGADGLSTLVEAARTLAAHLGKPVRAIASGVERQLGVSRVEIGYRAYEVTPEGDSRTFSVSLADEACGEIADDHPNDELYEIFATLRDDEGPAVIHAGERGRCFRRKALLDDPRLARLAAAIMAAKAVSFEPEPGGRVRVKIDASDGAKQISMVSPEEAETLRRATRRA
jgi:hypothetical protein